MESRGQTPLTAERLRTLPTAPGVYLMKNTQGKVIYVGKAKNLRARVRNYFGSGDGRVTVKFLVKQIATVDTVVTVDEREAIILENDLIKKYKPRYNVRLKDDKAHYVVRIDIQQPWPRVELVRQIQDDGARYIGPFAYGYELKSLLEVVRSTVPLRTCTDSVLKNRVRPCIEYQIKRCLAPCCLPVPAERYKELVSQAIDILQGRDTEVVARLEAEMERLSEELRYEDAAAVRDRLAVLRTVAVERSAVNYGAASKDIFGLHREGSSAELVVLKVRQGRIFAAQSYGFQEVEVDGSELLATLVSQFYQGDQEFPDEIVIPLALPDRGARRELYSERRGKPVKLVVPERGEKLQLLRLAETNARENFIARPGAARRSEVALEELRDEFELSELPRLIECVDVSHFQGGQTVGSVVCFKDGVPDKTRYRAFKLSQEGKPDDFASMRELVHRHLSHGVEEGAVCDLLVVDGGVAQLNQALLVRRELGIETPAMIGLAKKRTRAAEYRGASRAVTFKPERVFMENQSLPVVLKPTSEACHLLERLRDEAHRFAITFHRKSRHRVAFKSELDVVPGVGPERRRRLLRAFGGISQIRSASVEELSEKGGVPLSLAKRILSFLKKK